MVTLLSDIIDSKQPAELLAFMLVAPLRSFSAKELSNRLHTTVVKVNSGARLLEQNNYIKSFAKNQAKFFRLNLNHPQVKELRKQCLAEQGHWPDELALSLKKLGQLSGIFLSGLFVARPELPVDVLLVGKVSPSKLEIFLGQTSKIIGSELNYSVMSREEFVLRRDTFDRFIKDIFDYPHIVITDKSVEDQEKPKTVATKKANKAPAKQTLKAKPKKKTVKKKAKTATKKTATKKTVKKAAKKVSKKIAKKSSKKVVKKKVKKTKK